MSWYFHCSIFFRFHCVVLSGSHCVMGIGVLQALMLWALCCGCASGTCVLGIGVLQVLAFWALVCFRYSCCGHCVVGIVLWALVCCRYSCSGHCVVGIGVLQVLNWYASGVCCIVGIGALQVVSWYAEVFIVLWPLVCFRYTYGKPVKGFLNLLVCPSGYGTFGQACATRQVEVSTCLYVCFGCGCVSGVVCVCVSVWGGCASMWCACVRTLWCVCVSVCACDCLCACMYVCACSCVHVL